MSAHPRVARGNLHVRPDSRDRGGLTPASRGETRQRRCARGGGFGSPPRRAGKPTTRTPVFRSSKGSPPRRAGKPDLKPSHVGPLAAHPRVARGNPTSPPGRCTGMGLTPASRGETGGAAALASRGAGSPPRRAGKPSCGESRCTSSAAHPRVARGNLQVRAGRRPLGGLTPASRGETPSAASTLVYFVGSPPRRAGKPDLLLSLVGALAAHPRVARGNPRREKDERPVRGLTPASRGETQEPFGRGRPGTGSPPRRAGKPDHAAHPDRPGPAHPRVARGNLASGTPTNSPSRLTPASRGETAERPPGLAVPHGSPPRRAGKPR